MNSLNRTAPRAPGGVMPARKPESDDDPGRQKARIESHIAAVLNAIAASGREPDAWEAMQLHAAIGALVGGNYFVADTHVHLALTALAKRSTSWPCGDGTAHCADLRASLVAVAALDPQIA